ncbi:MAG: ATP-dependent nuclease [Solirubrobacterales bacterium]
MLLRSVYINGYRRFATPQILRIDGALTAVIGPSQSGKSSVIGALDELRSTRPVSVRDLASASESTVENPLVVSAQFDFPTDLIEGMADGHLVPVRQMKHADGTELTMHQTSRGRWVLIDDVAFYRELPRFEELRVHEARESLIPLRDMRGELEDSVIGSLLAGLGGLALESLPDLIERDRDAATEAVGGAETRINEHLDRDLVGFPGLKVAYVVHEYGLEMKAATNDSGMRPIADQSAGLQRFIGMVAAVSWGEMRERRELPPIVLIDELETHLHVDAQTDFVRYLEVQEAVLQVIYTTHSMTALPGDLGTGLRAITPTGPDQSEIVNSPWSLQREPGPSPVFVAAGASSSAFAALRRAVFTEGPSDPVLLPSLLRAVIDEDEKLDFQCLPGLAWISRSSAGPLHSAAARTVHLVDGDDGGAGIRDLLLDLDVPDEDIIVLGADLEHPVVLEDLVDAERYRNAIVDVLRQMTEGELPEAPAVRELRAAWNRPALIRSWADENSLPVPGKVEVAERVLADLLPRGIIVDVELKVSLVEPGREEILRTLFSQIQGRLPSPQQLAQ